MKKLQAAAMLAAGIAVGAGGAKLSLASADPGVFQETRIYRAGVTPRTGLPLYGSATCRMSADEKTACATVDLTAAQATCFETYLNCAGLK